MDGAPGVVAKDSGKPQVICNRPRPGRLLIRSNDMRKKNQLEDPPQEVAQPETELPPGVKLKHTLRGHTGPIGRIAWSPDGRTLASPSADSTIRLWNSETGQCVRKLKGQGGGHECVAFDPAGKILAAKNSDGTVGVWDIASGILTKILKPGRPLELERVGDSLKTSERREERR